MPIDRDSLYSQIGKRLQQKRSALGMTQLELAKHVNLSRTSIANIEAGNQFAPVHVLYELCVALQVRPLDLFPEIEGITSPIMIGDSIAAELDDKAAKWLRALVRNPKEGDSGESVDSQD